MLYLGLCPDALLTMADEAVKVFKF